MQSKPSNCPFCQSKHISYLHDCKDHTLSQEHFEVWLCTDCEGGFTAHAPQAEKIGAYYQSENYISHSNTRKGLVNRLYHWAREWMLKSKTQLIDSLQEGKKGRLLDIGSGTGYFLRAMSQKAWQTQGIEPDQKAREFSIQEFGLQVDAPEKLFQLSAQTYDVITLWHVLEHIHTLDEYWQAFGRLLKANGTLIIAVPNRKAWDASFYGPEWAAWDVPRHLWHFAPKTFEIIAQRYGFQVIRKKIMPFDPFYISLLSEKYRQNPLALPMGFLRGFYSLLLSLSDTNRGSSLIYVCKKTKIS
jgi:SAM-dependent methyltransferase